VASAMVGLGSNFSYLQLYGGDPAASNYMTPFGGSQGLLWNWSGPGGFSSAIQNPTNDTTWGTYQLIVTEKRNGCKDTALKSVSFWDFGTLASKYLNLRGGWLNESVQLNWQDIAENNALYYEVQKSSASSGFETIATVSHPKNTNNHFGYTDNNPYAGDNFYRIKSTTSSGLILYSNIIDINSAASTRFYLTQGSGDRQVSLACMTDKNIHGKLIIYNTVGQVLALKDVQFNKGVNTVDLPSSSRVNHQVLVVSLYVDDRLSFSQKILL